MPDTVPPLVRAGVCGGPRLEWVESKSPRLLSLRKSIAMAPALNPYQSWLGIPLHEQPANHYRLLGLLLYESNPAVIARAADRVLAVIQNNRHQDPGFAQQLEREVASARHCLLDPRAKAAYDQELRSPPIAVAPNAMPPAAMPPSAALGGSALPAPPGIPSVAAAPPSMALPVPLPAPAMPPVAARRPIPLSPASTEVQPPVPVLVPVPTPPSSLAGTRSAANPVPRHRRQEESSVLAMSLVAKYVLGGLAGVMIGCLIVYFLTGQDVVGFLGAGSGDLPTKSAKPRIARPHPQVASNSPANTSRLSRPAAPTEENTGGDDQRPASPESPSANDAAASIDAGDANTVSSSTVSPTLPVAGQSASQAVPNIAARPNSDSPVAPGLSSLLTPRQRQPSPTTDQQEAALAKIQEIYQREFERAAQPEQARPFLIFLLARAREFRTDPLVQFVFLRQAYDQAVKQREFEIAADAIDHLERDYALDGYRLRMHLLKEAAHVAKLPEARAPLALFALDMSEHAIAADREADVSTLAELAATLGRGISSREFREKYAARLEAVQAIEREAAPAREARARLVSNPTDPAASLIEGKHRCFTRGDWSAGLPLLAQADDPELGKRAAADLATSADDRAAAIRAGDQWFDLAAAGPELAGAYRRAQHWYEKAIAHTDGLERLRLEKRLEAIRSLGLPEVADPASAANQPPLPTARSMVTRVQPFTTTSVLEHLTPQTLRSAGWTFASNLLRVDAKAPRERLQSPVSPAGEYDVEIRLRRTTRSRDPARTGPFVMGLPGPDSQVLVVVDLAVPGRGYASFLSYGESVKLDANPTVVFAPDGEPRLSTSREVLVSCAVRYGRVTVAFDGIPAIEYEGDMSELKMISGWSVPNTRSLFIGAHEAGLEIIDWRYGPPAEGGFVSPRALNPPLQGFGPTPE